MKKSPLKSPAFQVPFLAGFLMLILSLTGCNDKPTSSSPSKPSASAAELPAPPPIAQPVHIPDSLISLSIPDVHQTLDAAQALADQILPSSNKVNIKSKLGTMIGDPELKGFRDGDGIVVLWDGQLGSVLIQCTQETAEKLKPLLIQGMPVSHFEDNLLFLSTTQAGIDAVKKQRQEIVERLLNQERTGIIVHAQVADLLKKFEPQINMMMVMMPNMMAQSSAQMSQDQAESMQGMAKIVEVEMKVMLSLLSQIESAEISVIPSPTGIAYHQTYDIKADTRMHTLIHAPATVSPDPRISTAYLPEGTFELEMFWNNPTACHEFMRAEVEQVTRDMNLDPAKASKWLEIMDKMNIFFSGNLAEAIGINPDTGMTMGFLMSVQDEETFLETFKSMEDLTKPFTQMYRDMGMPMEFDITMNARNIDGFAVHQYDFAYDLENMPPEMAAQFEAMHMAEMKSEMAIVDHRVLWTMGATPLEDLIHQIQSKKIPATKLQARSDFPAGGFLYYDVDFGQYMAYIAKMMPPSEATPAMDSMVAALKQSPPMTGAGFQSGNLISIQSLIPVDFLKAAVQTGLTLK